MNIQKILTNFKKLNQQSELKIDSRKLSPNDVFIAIKGQNFDEDKFIQDAITKKVGLILKETRQSKKSLQNDPDKYKVKSEILENSFQPQSLSQNGIIENINVKVIEAKDIQTTIQQAVNIFYPSIPENLLVVTGTNGKTSVVTYIQQLVEMLGKPSACIGTIGIQTSLHQTEMTTGLQDVVNNSVPLTTPQMVDLRRELHHMATNNIHHVAFEASSHGIHQKRIGDLKAHCAGFTSFSQDHLNYHEDMDTYLRVKLSLFKNNLKNGGTVVINSETNELSKITKLLDDNKIKFITVGKNGDLNIQKISPSLTNQTVEFFYLNRCYKFQTTIFGSYQITNILIAALMVHLCGFNFDYIVSKLHKLTAPKCRLDRVTDVNHHYHVFVDFAHSPDAIDKALGELAKFKQKGKLKVVFGASGGRDRGIRPQMGYAASKWADEAIVTENNDRFEDGEKIREQIISGMAKDKCRIINIPDRIRAIKLAIKGLREGDILLICGKGPQDYIHIKGTAHPYLGDTEIARQLLRGNLSK